MFQKNKSLLFQSMLEAQHFRARLLIQICKTSPIYDRIIAITRYLNKSSEKQKWSQST